MVILKLKDNTWLSTFWIRVMKEKCIPWDAMSAERHHRFCPWDQEVETRWTASWWDEWQANPPLVCSTHGRWFCKLPARINCCWWLSWSGTMFPQHGMNLAFSPKEWWREGSTRGNTLSKATWTPSLEVKTCLVAVNEWMKEDREGKWVRGLCASTQEGWKV